ncbi:signal transduction histidine kinase [Marmoricola sp. OAE513]|uniref:sensor histidine kinase n=1 Tax=Marmoricola sp. OAE513 TaxID=2817894 RepID=UPI001AE13263
MTTAPTRDRAPIDWREWVPDVLVGLVVLGFGLSEALSTDYVPYSAVDFQPSRVALVWVALATALAVGLSRRAPSLGLAIVWAVCGYELSASIPVMYVQLTVAAVAFGAARWGHTATVILSGLSIPVAGAIAVIAVNTNILGPVVDAAQFRRLMDTVQRVTDSWQLGAAVLGMVVLAVPWLIGLTVRFSSRAAASEASQQVAEREAARALRESEQAKEIARLREEQTQLARDVHDVVGHSLAVILAQAESAQYLDEADTSELRRSMANIASSARGSLQDVRQVLTSTNEPLTGPGDLRELVEGVRSSGHEVRFTEVGTPRPLPPELATVAYRVLQEMLTNAIRHGSRTSPLEVELEWREWLRIQVVNSTDIPGPPTEGGHGLVGMRRRLESAGGRLELGPFDRPTFSATAWVPMRTVVT